MEKRKILISAGETSSDLYGAQLMEALRRREPEIEFMGVGGERMRAAGCEIVVDAKHLAVVGITEIVSHLPRIYGEFRKLLRAVDSASRKPDLAIVIDSPAFNFRVAREMHRRGVPVIYFVAPQLWAWRQYRVRRMQKWIKKVLCIFPFEPEFYRAHGVEAEYVGHPLADLPAPSVTREQFAAENGLDASKTWIALLPGSRNKEIRAHLPAMMEATKRLAQKDSGLQFVIPVVPSLRRLNLAATQGIRVAISHDSRATLLHARAAVVASGTATVEAALMNCPSIAVYRLSPLTFHLARRMVKVAFVAMPNLIAKKQVVPELLQSEFTAENIVSQLEAILADGPAREKMLDGLSRVRAALRPEAGRSAVERAAEAVLQASEGASAGG